MSFENLYLMLILLVPFIVFVLLVSTNKDGVERVFPIDVLDRIRVEGSGVSNRVRDILLFGAIFMMIVAVGHPYIAKGERDIKLGGLEITLALDISGSMRSQDRYPSRLDFAKEKSKKLLEYLVEDEVMLLTFSDSLFLVSPTTSDKETLKVVIDGISKEYLQGGSNFTALAEGLQKSLQNRPQKIVVIVSDGGDSGTLAKLKEVLAKEKIKLYALLVGTKEGAPILDRENKAVLQNDKIVMSRLNMELADVAKGSGGDYVIADYSGGGVEILADMIHQNLAINKSQKMLRVSDRVELFYYPLLLGLLLLFLSLFSRPNGNLSKRFLS
ncbi:MAG TPA: VWA domain-containing protein, partial [Nitratifractor sp.]|nr:VWA domain-containing protein [Nitratifractor sp.]